MKKGDSGSGTDAAGPGLMEGKPHYERHGATWPAIPQEGRRSAPTRRGSEVVHGYPTSRIRRFSNLARTLPGRCPGPIRRRFSPS